MAHLSIQVKHTAVSLAPGGRCTTAAFHTFTHAAAAQRTSRARTSPDLEAITRLYCGQTVHAPRLSQLFSRTSIRIISTTCLNGARTITRTRSNRRKHLPAHRLHWCQSSVRKLRNGGRHSGPRVVCRCQLRQRWKSNFTALCMFSPRRTGRMARSSLLHRGLFGRQLTIRQHFVARSR